MPCVLIGDEIAFFAISGKVSLTMLGSGVVRPFRITYSRAVTLVWKVQSSSCKMSPAGIKKTSLLAAVNVHLVINLTRVRDFQIDRRKDAGDGRRRKDHLLE